MTTTLSRKDLTRPIIGIENRTAQEVFDIMCDRFRRTPPASAPEAEREKAALETFTEYFVRNYPGPDTTIGDPHWHAPKIFRAALHALKTSAALSSPALPGLERVEALETALRRIAGMNDLSGVADDDVEAAARNALYECELIALEALERQP